MAAVSLQRLACTHEACALPDKTAYRRKMQFGKHVLRKNSSAIQCSPFRELEMFSPLAKMRGTPPVASFQLV